MNKNILFIGAGKLGTTLASALSQSGFVIPFFYSKEIPDNRKVYFPNTTFVNELRTEYFENTEIVIITVPDEQIKIVAEQLDSLDIIWESKIIMHTSGCLNSTELGALKLNGAQVGSIHPMQSFDKHFMPKTIFENIIFSVEGDTQVQTFLEKIAELLNAKVTKLKPEDKILYHIAAVASSNFFVALLDYVGRLYKNLDFDENKIKELIVPIVSQSLNNFKNAESKNILTGPLKRGDFSTIENHVKYLKDNQEEMLPVYSEISKYISQFILKHNESENHIVEREKLKRIFDND
jgi:predicted short-subunit dehydrogenase-like oxidoreductase (DUF2520 family)